MSCIFKIKEANETLTHTEKRIAEYICAHKEATIHASAQELAEVTTTSAAAIVRFSKKIGYKGFTAMKVDLAKDSDEVEEAVDTLILQEDSIETLIKKAQINTYQSVDQTYKMINSQTFERAINALVSAKNIYMLGVGGSGNVCNDFQYKLTCINRSVIYHEDAHILLARMALINRDDVVLAISYSGETKEINTAIKHARAIGATCIAITKFDHKSTLSKLANIILHVPNEEQELRLGAIVSCNSALILTDLLYYGIAKANMIATKENLGKTRSLLRELK